MFMWHCCYVSASIPMLVACMKPEQVGKASVLAICEGLSLQEPRDQQVGCMPQGSFDGQAGACLRAVTQQGERLSCFTACLCHQRCSGRAVAQLDAAASERLEARWVTFRWGAAVVAAPRTAACPLGILSPALPLTTVCCVQPVFLLCGCGRGCMSRLQHQRRQASLYHGNCPRHAAVPQDLLQQGHAGPVELAFQAHFLHLHGRQ